MIEVQANKRRRVSPPGPKDAPASMVVRDTLQDEFFTRAAGWNLEQDYEQRPRKQQKKDKDVTRLPIKTAEGRIQQLEVSQPKSEEWDGSLESGSDGSQDPELQATIEAKTDVPIKQQVLDAKEELARIASLINEDPEEHAGGFRKLASIASSSNSTIKKLALATQLAVYKDAIPGYRIRPMAEADQTEKVSKDVRKLRAFEQTLVGSYQSYVQELSIYAKTSTGKSSEPSQMIASVAIACACNLLVAVPHFNFRGDLLKILITKLSSRNIDAEFVRCRETIETLFHADDDGTASLDAVGLITRMMKSRNYHIDESVLNTFLHLRLLSEFTYKASQNRIEKPATDVELKGKKPKFKKEFRTKKQRKMMKDRKEVEKEFKEADAIVSHEQRDRMQSETLKLVFVTYFRILKARIPDLMGAVLEGLAKYAHLINQDFFGDLLEALKDLILDAEAHFDPEAKSSDDEEGPSIKPESSRDYSRESLLCTTTAFALLEGQDAAKSASALSLDLTFFFSHLYRNLHALSLNPDLELSSKTLRLPDPHSHSDKQTLTMLSKVNLQTTVVLLLRALKATLTPRSVPPIRLAAFTKQLFTASLQVPEKSDLAMLSLLNNVAMINGRKIASLWNTEERRGDGVFDALRGDLEASNPFASTIWEGELLKLHFAPGVREGIRGIDKVIADIK